VHIKAKLVEIAFLRTLEQESLQRKGGFRKGGDGVGGKGENGSLLGQHIQIELRGGKSPTKAQKIFNFNAVDTSSKETREGVFLVTKGPSSRIRL